MFDVQKKMATKEAEVPSTVLDSQAGPAKATSHVVDMHPPTQQLVGVCWWHPSNKQIKLNL